MKTMLAALALAVAATTALAESPASPVQALADGTSHLTRADVRQQVLDARHAGTLLRAGELGQVPEPFVSQRTRAQVRAEMLHGRHAVPFTDGYQPA